MDERNLRCAIRTTRETMAECRCGGIRGCGVCEASRLLISAAESLLAGVPCKVIHAAHGMWGTTAAAVPFDLGPGQECDAVIVRLPAE